MKFFKKIQALPEAKRKVFFWAVLILVGGLAFLLWFYQASYALKKLEKDWAPEGIGTPKMENLNIDDLKQDWQKLNEVKNALEKAAQDEAPPQDLNTK